MNKHQTRVIMHEKIFLRLIAVLLAYALFRAFPTLSYGVSFLVTLQPAFVAMGLLAIAGWICGTAATGMLLWLQPASRWFLLAFLVLDGVGNTMPWLPFVWELGKSVDDPYGMVAIFVGSNLCVLAAVFWLFRRLRPQDQAPSRENGNRRIDP